MNAAQSRTLLYEAKGHQVTLAKRPNIVRSQPIPQLRIHDAFFLYSHALIVRFDDVFSTLRVHCQVSYAPPLPRAVSTLYTRI